MAQVPILYLSISLIVLILISGFFSGSETGLMSINRYRLRHRARSKYRPAMRVNRMLERPDRLLGVILIGNTFANIVAASIATIIAVRLLGDVGVAIATICLTLVVLIFAEIMPKTLAAFYPERFAFTVSWPLQFLLRALYPIVWLANTVVNGLLSLMGVNVQKRSTDRLSKEELRTVVLDSKGRISSHHQDMLLRILDIDKVTVDDVMVRRNDIVGLDIEENWAKVLKQLTGAEFTRLPLYRADINHVIGIVNMRDALSLLANNQLNKDSLEKIARPVYYIPEGTPLNTQLLNFREEKRRSALVVDEYGDILGLVTLEDVVEELVGELADTVPSVSKYVTPDKDGSYLLDGSANIREINRLMGWHFPVDGPKTLNGLIIEYLETIPEHSACLRLNGYPVEIIEVKENMVKTARVYPNLRKEPL